MYEDIELARYLRRLANNRHAKIEPEKLLKAAKLLDLLSKFIVDADKTLTKL